MKKIINGDTRKPIAGHLNFGPGIDAPNPTRPMGPNTFGELLWPVTFEQSPLGSRVGFSYAAPAAELVPEWVEVPA